MTNRDSSEAQLQFGDDENIIRLRKALDRTVRALTPSLTETSNLYLRSTVPVSMENDNAVVAVPSRFRRDWLENRHGEQIRATLALHLECPNLRLHLVLATSEIAKTALANRDIAGDSEAAVNSELSRNKQNGGTDARNRSSSLTKKTAKYAPIPEELSVPFSSRDTFDTFIVGKSNRLAHAGALAVAQSPGKVYNPLFLYGPPGIGKTHLMHAIGNSLRAANPDVRVAYLSGEAFANLYIQALREKRFEEFRKIFRSVDVWLVDDVQTLSGMEHTKEEFFHTFNALHQTGKQIVLSSDKPPHELRFMDERLRQRFESGLIADVNMPEIETRIAILQQRVDKDNLDVPSDVLAYMASLIQSNIRSLGGALIRLSAYASLNNLAITKELAREVLAGFFIDSRKLKSNTSSGAGESIDNPCSDNESPLRSMPLPDFIGRARYSGATDKELFDHIVRQVAQYFEIDTEFIAGDGSASTSRRRGVSGARQIAIFLARERTKLQVKELAELFGGVDHSAITHAHSKMKKQIIVEPQILADIQAIRKKIER